MNYNGGAPPAQAPGRQFSDQANLGNPNAQYQSPIGGGFGGNSGPEFDLTADFPSLGGGENNGFWETPRSALQKGSRILREAMHVVTGKGSFILGD